jgi:hypothetical protein
VHCLPSSHSLDDDGFVAEEADDRVLEEELRAVEEYEGVADDDDGCLATPALELDLLVGESVAEEPAPITVLGLDLLAEEPVAEEPAPITTLGLDLLDEELVAEEPAPITALGLDLLAEEPVAEEPITAALELDLLAEEPALIIGVSLCRPFLSILHGFSLLPFGTSGGSCDSSLTPCGLATAVLSGTTVLYCQQPSSKMASAASSTACRKALPSQLLSGMRLII